MAASKTHVWRKLIAASCIRHVARLNPVQETAPFDLGHSERFTGGTMQADLREAFEGNTSRPPRKSY